MALNIRASLRGSVFGLATALCFSVSPIFVRLGMAEGFSAEIALTVGLTAAAISYLGVLFVVERRTFRIDAFAGMKPVLWETAAAVAIVTGTWLRYIAMASVPLAIVSALGRVNILVILFLERRGVSARVWIGGILIILGTVLFSFG